jgi:hypothetical protein
MLILANLEKNQIQSHFECVGYKVLSAQELGILYVGYGISRLVGLFAW